MAKSAWHERGTTEGGRSRWRAAIGPVVLFAAVMGLYASSLRNDFIYDDTQLIVRQPTPRSAADLAQVFAEPHFPHLPYYRPVARLTLVVQKYFHDQRPGPYHLFNAGLIAAVALAVYALLRLPVFGVRTPIALLAAALFAGHPIASSCVYAISGREALMSAFFILAALYAFLQPGWHWRLVAILAFALSLLCREQAAIVPALFVLADLLHLSREPPGRSAGRWVRRYIPVAAIMLAYLVTRWLVFGGETTYRLAVVDRPAGPLLSLLYALQTTFVPFVELVYEPRADVWMSAWRQAVWVIAVGALAVVARRSWPAVRAPLIFWLGWFFLALVPTANLLVQEAPFAERSGFLALLGVIGIAGVLASTAWDPLRARRGLIIVGIALVGLCGAISFHRGRYFKNSEVFLDQWLRTDQDAPQAHISLGFIALEQGRLVEAITHYRRALERMPWHAETHYGLGFALREQGKLEEAISHYRQALEAKPDFVQAHDHLGFALATLGNVDEAMKHFRRALELDPDYASAQNNLAWALATHTEPNAREANEAISLAEQACQSTRHRDAGFLDTLAAAYAAAGRFDQAVTTGQAALALATEAQADDLANEIRNRLRLYRQGMPYVERPDEPSTNGP